MDTVIVAGATGGIGQAVVERLEDYYNVIAWGSHRADNLTSPIVVDAAVDVQGATAVEEAVAEAAGKKGLWGVVNCAAAGAAFQTAAEADLGMWDRIMRVDLRGSFLLARAAAARMERGGRIVLFSSYHGIVGSYSYIHPAYPAAKAGVAGLVKRLALEYAPRGITVNAVAPGPILTPRTRDNAARGAIDLPAMVRRCPMGRLGKPEEVAALVEFLLGEGAGWLTGQTVVMDGGWGLDLEGK